jgi:hypothetical protein
MVRGIDMDSARQGLAVTTERRAGTMDPILKYYVVMPISLLWALVSIHGGRRGWKCLIHPPLYLKPVYSYVRLQALFGTHVIKNMAVMSGWISLGIAFYVMHYF